ncbi:hypothetical protein ASPZODRAFT_75313 [Penicilliopsis zonata CBS 506.65]|uniref:Uncharacterized protein n=1 Tax=Penicilliopsis zonata CBS 506.65 TaxID=1073090 RepID=A0A1L9S6Z2_9EURO|nr:hypothetical protein ASPZODRAFT_75313 [Penicilliopsis zonata CBS 506.65]OJJ42925.1 hypothetical protein ASPZODRAFT_75313 [Penicilliopsis zonata CBS 506.65]
MSTDPKTKVGGVASLADPRTGPAPTTAGPHRSDLANKLDPRVDSDLNNRAQYAPGTTLSGNFHPGTTQQLPSPSSASNYGPHEAIMEEPQYTNTLSGSDSDDPARRSVDLVQEDEADEMVGVSISRTQSRMKARRTPAEEKTRMMERHGGFFETIPDDDDGEKENTFLPEITAEPESLVQSSSEETSHAKPPATTTSGTAATSAAATAATKPKDGQRTSFTRSILKNGLPLRSRAWSGDAITNLKKKFLPDLGSLAKRSTLAFRSGSSSNQNRQGYLSSNTSPSHSDEESPRQQPRQQQQQQQQQTDGFWRSCSNLHHSPTDELVPDLQGLDATGAAKHSYTRRPSVSVNGRPRSLHRSASDHSLYLRASSTASSLEQRPRYENIHSQVNSRFKAIKDSLQDSSSRLLSMPTLHLQDFRTEWGYRPFTSDVHQRMHPPTSGNSFTSNGGNHTSNGVKSHTPSPRSNSASLYPILSEAMSEMTGDVVVMGGYRGSILRSAKPPHRQLWVPMKVGLNLRKVDLEVGLEPEDEETMPERIIPSGVLSHIGPVDICRRLLRQLQKCDNAVRGDLRVWDYGYDWRLSPHLLARQLIRYLEGLPCNSPNMPPERRGAIVIAHSLGGLITRHAVNQRPELFAGVLYAGVPQHCVNILGPLRNGDDVLLSSRVLTAQVNFTFRTSFALLPEDGRCFINRKTKEEYPVDFFSADAWDTHRLSPCLQPALPASSSASRGTGFIDQLQNKARIPKRLSSMFGQEMDGPEIGNEVQQKQEQEQEQEQQPNTTSKAVAALESSVNSVAAPPTSPRTTTTTTKIGQVCTIPRPAAMAYLRRTLAEIKQFKTELAFNPTHQSQNRYPPFAVLYGKSVPTVYGARVSSRETIQCQDAYDDLAFAAGDGVCLASAAMLPAGYRIIKDGLVKSDRGHVGLLGDLEGVGQCLRALVRGRREGVGMNVER